jgi:hypothetical protein
VPPLEGACEAPSDKTGTRCLGVAKPTGGRNSPADKESEGRRETWNRKKSEERLREESTEISLRDADASREEGGRDIGREGYREEGTWNRFPRMIASISPMLLGGDGDQQGKRGGLTRKMDSAGTLCGPRQEGERRKGSGKRERAGQREGRRRRYRRQMMRMVESQTGGSCPVKKRVQVTISKPSAKPHVKETMKQIRMRRSTTSWEGGREGGRERGEARRKLEDGKACATRNFPAPSRPRFLPPHLETPRLHSGRQSGWGSPGAGAPEKKREARGQGGGGRTRRQRVVSRS